MDDLQRFPALKEATGFINDKITKGIWQPGERLPSIRSLALSARISVPTMWKAMTLLRKDGTLLGTPHRRLFVAGPGKNKEALPEKILQWQQKREIIEKEILSGVVGSNGILPSLKEMQARYGICFSTIKKIMRAMVDDGVITPRGKGFSLPAIRGSTSRRRLIFLTMKGHYSQRSSLNNEHNRVVTLFENECKRAGLNLDIIEIDFYNSAESRRIARDLTINDQTLGVFLDVWWYETDVFRQNYIDVLTRLAHVKKPVAILDELGLFELPVQFVLNPLLQVFTVEEKPAGERIARFLLGLGHRKVTYISLFHYSTWARSRYDGLLAQFSRAGLADGVQLIAESVDVYLPNLLTVSGLGDADVRGLVSIDRTPAQAADMESRWEEFKKANKAPYAGHPRLDSATAKGLVDIFKLFRQNPGHPFYIKACAGALDAIGKLMFEMCVRPLLEQAIKRREDTAWICANDGIAFGALSFLNEKNVRVPGDISVTGFDNVPVTALEQGLTTVDFNASAFVNRMLNFIIRPPKPRGPYRHTPIEIESIIMERGSTGKAKPK